MNPNATITDEQFKAYLKKVRDMVEGPYTEWQKEIEVTNTFPEKFYQSNIDNDIYRYSLPEMCIRDRCSTYQRYDHEDRGTSSDEA